MADFIGAFAVTTGIGLDAIVAEFEAANDDYSAILAKALADRLAEAFAERLHERVRQELWGYAPTRRSRTPTSSPSATRGSGPPPATRPARTTRRRGRSSTCSRPSRAPGSALTELFAMWPGAAVSGYYLWNPDSHYFGVGRIGRDQLADYATRKGVPLDDAARWLAPNLVDEEPGG